MRTAVRSTVAKCKGRRWPHLAYHVGHCKWTQKIHLAAARFKAWLM
jgi:hypothetical protein